MPRTSACPRPQFSRPTSPSFEPSSPRAVEPRVGRRSSVTRTRTSVGMTCLALLLALAGCGDSAFAPMEGEVASIGVVMFSRSNGNGNGGVGNVSAGGTVASVTPGAGNVGIGVTLQLVAYDANGNQVNPNWSSSNTGVASVNSSGLVTGVSAGGTTVTAKTKNHAAEASITVLAGTPAATVQVSPSTATVEIGKTAQLSATVRDGAGNVMSGAPVLWASSNTAVATVSPAGVVTALASGIVKIAATSGGVSGMAEVTVPTTQTSSTGSGAAPWLVEDFSTYTSTTHMLSDPRGIYARHLDANTWAVTLDGSTGYGASTKSMRYTVPTLASKGKSSGCYEETIRRVLRFPNNTRHFWAEWWFKTSPNFKTNWTQETGCGSNPDWKFSFFGKGQADGRWAIHMGTYGDTWMMGPNANNEVSSTYQNGQLSSSGTGLGYGFTHWHANKLWDGNWHRIRVEAKLGKGDAIFRFWADGELVVSKTGLIADDGEGFSSLSIGENFNMLPTEEMQFWLGSIKVWNQNPGW